MAARNVDLSRHRDLGDLLSTTFSLFGRHSAVFLTAAGGLDAILSIVQMPPGVPVGCVGLDNPRNAAHLALRILSA